MNKEGKHAEIDIETDILSVIYIVNWQWQYLKNKIVFYYRTCQSSQT